MRFCKFQFFISDLIVIPQLVRYTNSTFLKLETLTHATLYPNRLSIHLYFIFLICRPLGVVTAEAKQDTPASVEDISKEAWPSQWFTGPAPLQASIDRVQTIANF